MSNWYTSSRTYVTRCNVGLTFRSPFHSLWKCGLRSIVYLMHLHLVTMKWSADSLLFVYCLLCYAHLFIFCVVHLTTLSVYNRESNYVFHCLSKGKGNLDKSIEAQRGGGSVAPIHSQPVIGGRWVINTTFRQPANHCTAGWVGFGACQNGAEDLAPTGIRSPALRTY
jgi:hypothetical protein